jgi:hypothetical protein
MPWRLGDFPGFSLMACHPGLCGLTLAQIQDQYHTTSTNFAADQGQVLVLAHLYNAVHQIELLPSNVRWVDMDWLIEHQGSDWLFVGEKPKAGVEFGKHLNIAMSYPAYKFTQSYRSRKPEADVQTIYGGFRRLGYLARYSELRFERKDKKTRKISGLSIANDDILVMVEALTKDYLGNDNLPTNLSSLQKLSTFKLAVEKDEFALSFNMMDLYLRCLKLLQRIRIYAFVYAPHNYPKEKFDKGLGMNTVIGEMLYELAGERRHHPSLLPAAAAMLRKVIEEEGSVVLREAEARQEEMKFRKTAPESEVEPSFENPFEDMFSLKDRSIFGQIIFQDGNGDCRMPFGMR